MENTGSLFLSLNFEEGIPGRIMLVPAGKVVKGRDGREWKNPDPKQTAADSGARLAFLPVDENHSTDLAAPKGGASPAMGWMKNLCADGNGAIWADVEWTERGRDALAKKEYRFISPVFLHNEKNEMNYPALQAGYQIFLRKICRWIGNYQYCAVSYPANYVLIKNSP